VAELLFASEAALALNALEGASLSEFSFKGVDQALLKLLEEGDTVRPDADADEGTAYHAGLALQLLGYLAQKVPSAVDQVALCQFTDEGVALFSMGVTGSGNAAIVSMLALPWMEDRHRHLRMTAAFFLGQLDQLEWLELTQQQLFKPQGVVGVEHTCWEPWLQLPSCSI